MHSPFTQSLYPHKRSLFPFKQAMQTRKKSLQTQLKKKKPMETRVVFVGIAVSLIIGIMMNP